MLRLLVMLGLLLLSGCATQQAVQEVADLNHPQWMTAKPTTIGSAADSSDQTLASAQRILKIAVMLPLAGKFAAAGNAVKAGFMAAEQQAFSPKPRISYYDVNNFKDIDTAYQQAIADGAQLVVGPLDKQQVQQLARQASLTVPVLALNLSTSAVQSKQFWQYSLSPLDEARQAADKAWQDGYQDALVIAPSNAWGQGIAKAFSLKWQQLGGKIIGRMDFANEPRLYAPQIRQLTKAVTSRQKTLIFMAAPASIARQLRPLLKFYDAGYLPIYATSLVYEGKQNPGLDSDLNGIQFCDMPWVISYLSPEQQQLAKQLPPELVNQTRLFAMGIDAYQLASQFLQLSQADWHWPGVTGDLHLIPSQQIARQLPWATFMQGIPHLQQPQTGEA